MSILRGHKPTVRDKIRAFHLNQYWGLALLLLCFPLLPREVPEFHGFFRSRWWLAADALVIWAIGAFFEHRLYLAVARDAQERSQGGHGLNVTSLLFFATPLMLLLNCAGAVHLFAMQHATVEALALTLDSRLQCGAVMVGLALYVYGRFLPTVRYGSLWGIPSPAAKQSEQAWQTEHRRYARRMVLGGGVLLILALLLPGASALAIACAGAVALMLSCFLSRRHP